MNTNFDKEFNKNFDKDDKGFDNDFDKKPKNPCNPNPMCHKFSKVVAKWETVRHFEVRSFDTLPRVFKEDCDEFGIGEEGFENEEQDGRKKGGKEEKEEKEEKCEKEHKCFDNFNKCRCKCPCRFPFGFC